MKLTEALSKSGISAIIYGESGMGKTHFLGTLPDLEPNKKSNGHFS